MNKVKVIVVEDEPAILQGVVKLIGNIALPLEIVGAYTSGTEALEELDLARPDIIVTDIQMPVMSGLEFIETVKNRGYQVESLILSGYSEFEYLQKAIRLSVDNYLLKPPRKEELEEFFRKSCERIEKVRFETTRKKFEEIILHGCDQDTLKIMEKDSYQVGVMMIGPYLEWGSEGIVYDVRKWKTVLEEQEMWVVQAYYPNVFVVISPENRNLAVTLYGLLGNTECEGHYSLSIVGSKQMCSIAALRKRVQDSIRVLQQKMEFGKNQIILLEEIQDIMDTKAELVRSDVDILYHMIKAGDGKAVEKQYLKCAKQCVEMNLSHGYFYQFTKQMLDDICAEAKQKFGMNIRDDAQNQLSWIAFRAQNFEEFVEANAKLIREVYAGINDGMERDYGIEECIDRLEQEIRAGVGTEVDINKFAKENGYHPVYLITQFSKLKGISPTKLLIQLRMERACKLLTESDMNLKVISETVGYNDVSYFSRAFKEYMGISPSSYRKGENAQKKVGTI